MRFLEKYLCTLLFVAGLLITSCHAHGQSTRPVYPPTTQPYPLDRIYFVDPGSGSDATGDGSLAKPLASVGKADTAITVARYSRPTYSNDAILIKVGVWPFHWNQSLNNDNCVIGSYGADLTKPDRGLGQRAILMCDQTGFSTGNHKGLHFVGIDLAVSSAYDISQQGIGFNFVRQPNGCDDVSLDNCTAEGFGEGVSFLGNNGARIRIWNCNLSNSVWIVKGIPNKAQGAYLEGAAPDIRYSVFGFNGWNNTLDLTNPTVVTQLMFSHGIYDSAALAANPKPAVVYGNLFICNAASGAQLRVGGVLNGNVFVTNGVACDAFTDGLFGSITGNLCLGNHESGLFTGGGLLGQSDQQTISGNIFYRFNPTSAPAQLLGWNSGGNDITGLPNPSTTSIADLCGNYGPWSGPAQAISVPRVFQTIVPNSVQTAGSPTQTQDLTTYAATIGFTGTTHAALVQWYHDNPNKLDVPGIISYFAPLASAAVAPVPPATQPAPVILGTGVTVDGTPFTVIKK